MDFPSRKRGLPDKRALLILITLVLLFFPVFALGSGATERKADESSNRETMLILTSNDSGQSLPLKVGDTFTVSLEENPTTGFQWAVNSTGGGLVQLQSSEYIPVTGARIGQGGQKVLTFKAQRPGSGQLQLKLALTYGLGFLPLRINKKSVPVRPTRVSDWWSILSGEPLANT